MIYLVRSVAVDPTRRAIHYSDQPWFSRVVCDSLYLARGQAENLVKLHKTQLASDRTSCRSALAIRSASPSKPPPIGSSLPSARKLQNT